MFKKMTILFSAMLFCAVAAQAATVSGVVKENDTAGAAIGGATVTLTPTGGGTALLDTTDNTGAFSIANVPGTAAAPVTYRIAAAKAGYRVMTNFTRVTVNNATGTFTQNLYLIPTATVGTYTVSGIVYDSLSGSALTPIVGARVILSSTAGFGATVHDTIATVTGGAYTFDSVAVGAYTLTVSDAAHATQTANITITVRNVATDFKLLRTVVASIAGTVTDSAAATAIVGAKVYLLTSGRFGALLDSTVTATGGTYTLSNVPSSGAGITYTVRASATDYVTGSVTATVTGTAATTANIKLIKIAMASITGTVTDSSTAGVALLAGVSVTLRTGGTTVDSVVTGADGKYTFPNVASGVTYTIRAALTGYMTSNTNIAVAGTTTRTVDIRMVKIPTGSLIIVVDKRTDSSAISGASVAATSGATVLSGTTGSTGVISFASVVTGTWGITITAAGFTAVNSTTVLVANRNDTVKVYLTAAAGGTKVLKGVVEDSSTSAPLQHVAVVLTVTGAGIGGGTLTLVDSTDVSGAYSFAGIPMARTTGTITATLAAYRTFTHAVNIGQPNTADTTAYNIAMAKVPVGVISQTNHASGNPDFSMTHKGILRLSNIGAAGSVKMFGMNGKLLYQSAISAHTASLTIPANVMRSGSVCIISLSQQNAVYRKQIMVP